MRGECKGEAWEGGGRQFWDPTYSEHIYNRKDEGGGVGDGCRGGGQGGLVWEVGLVLGVRFICIDPQDSDHEQLEIEGMEHKVWAYYIRCCLRGNVVVVVTVCQGKTNEGKPRHIRILSKKRDQRWNWGEGGAEAKVYELHHINPELSVYFTSM